MFDVEAIRERNERRAGRERTGWLGAKADIDALLTEVDRLRTELSACEVNASVMADEIATEDFVRDVMDALPAVAEVEMFRRPLSPKSQAAWDAAMERVRRQFGPTDGQPYGDGIHDDTEAIRALNRKERDPRTSE